MRWLRPSSLVGLIFVASACSTPGPTTIAGEAILRVDANTAPAITFPAGTTLPSDTPPTTSGLVVGQCAIGAESTLITFSRSAEGATLPTGFVWFQVSVDSPNAPYVGHVMAQYDDEVYEADCDLMSFARDRAHGVVDLELAACSLMAPLPGGLNSVSVDAALSLASCAVR